MLPPFIRQTPDEIAEVGMLRPVEVLYRTVLRQDWLSNELLLQRVLIRKTGSSSEKLISTAQAILKDILLITQRYDIALCYRRILHSCSSFTACVAVLPLPLSY